MAHPYADTGMHATIRTLTVCSPRKRLVCHPGRASRLLALPVVRGLLAAFSVLCFIGLGLAALPDGRGLLVGIALCLLLAGCARV